MKQLLHEIKNCKVCREYLPLGCNPVVQLGALSKVVIVGQAPGRKVHGSGIPWKDKSGETLRSWLGVDEATFYDSSFFSIMPMGFCYPGKGKSGDLPPRKECAPLWHDKILARMKTPPLLLLIGQYAQHYYLKEDRKSSLTLTVKNFKQYLPQYFPLPHPSPRNQNWVKINPWFMEEVIPDLQKRIKALNPKLLQDSVPILDNEFNLIYCDDMVKQVITVPLKSKNVL